MKPLLSTVRDRREIESSLRQMHRVWLLSAAPPIPHLEISLLEALEPLKAALDQDPAAAEHLKKLPLGESFIAVMALFGRALRIPVRVRGRQQDWAALAAVLRPHRGSYSARHAQRIWSQLQQKGRGVRAQRFSAAKGCRKGRKYRWAWRRRKDGTSFPSSSRTYNRALITSVAYATREALADHASTPVLDSLSRALRIPRSWRTGRWAMLRSTPLLRRTNFLTQLKVKCREDLADLFSALLRRSRYGVPKDVISKAKRFAVKKKKGPFGTPPGLPPARSPAPADARSSTDPPSTAAVAAFDAASSPDAPPIPSHHPQLRQANQGEANQESGPSRPASGWRAWSRILPGWIPPWELEKKGAKS